MPPCFRKGRERLWARRRNRLSGLSASFPRIRTRRQTRFRKIRFACRCLNPTAPETRLVYPVEFRMRLSPRKNEENREDRLRNQSSSVPLGRCASPPQGAQFNRSCLGGRNDHQQNLARLPPRFLFAARRSLPDTRQTCAGLNNPEKNREQFVIAIRPVKTVVSIGPVGDQTGRAQIGQLLLDGSQGQTAHHHQLADVTLLGGIGKEQPEDFRAHSGKENFQNRGRAFHNSIRARSKQLDWFIQSSRGLAQPVIFLRDSKEEAKGKAEIEDRSTRDSAVG
jgi:hypothetical protein